VRILVRARQDQDRSSRALLASKARRDSSSNRDLPGQDSSLAMRLLLRADGLALRHSLASSSKDRRRRSLAANSKDPRLQPEQPHRISSQTVMLDLTPDPPRLELLLRPTGHPEPQEPMASSSKEGTQLRSNSPRLHRRRSSVSTRPRSPGRSCRPSVTSTLLADTP
jgi:hypothetical protein